MVLKTSGGRDEIGESAFKLQQSLNARTPVDSSNVLISTSIACRKRSRECSLLRFIWGSWKTVLASFFESFTRTDLFLDHTQDHTSDDFECNQLHMQDQTVRH